MDDMDGWGREKLYSGRKCKGTFLENRDFLVLEAWRGLPDEMFAHSFKKCEISNSIDGAEGDILWKEDTDIKQESKNDESEDGGCVWGPADWGTVGKLFQREINDEDEFEGF